MALLFLGKLLIAVGLCFQAYVLLDNPTVAEAFNTKLAAVLSSCNCIPAEIQAHIREHLRMVVVGLLSCSILMVFLRSCFIKFLVLLGLGTLLYVRHHPLTQIPSFKDQLFWESLAVIGGIIYLMGAESCGSCSKGSKPKTD